MRFTSLSLLVWACYAQPIVGAPPLFDKHDLVERDLFVKRSLPSPIAGGARPSSTPVSKKPGPPRVLDDETVVRFSGAARGYKQGSNLGNAVKSWRARHGNGKRDVVERAVAQKPVRPSTTTTTTTRATTTTTSATSSSVAASSSSAAPPVSTISCLDSSNTEVQINSLFALGGANTTVVLCPGATILTSTPVQFTAAYQTLMTLGDPTDDTRATLVANGQWSNVIYGTCAYCDGITLKSVQINGNRPALGYNGGVDGNALVEFGGSNHNAVVTNCHIYNTRSWSCLHTLEGPSISSANDDYYCSGMTISNNQIGPCGTPAPNGAWADGISHACKNSVVSGNVVTDATDAGIVVFCAPGSQVFGNTVIAQNQLLLGGINGVDWGPFGGNFKGVNIYDNTVNAAGAMIKIGIAIGPLVWGAYDNPAFRNYGATFTNNKLTSGATGFFAFGVAIGAQNSTTVTGSTFQNANFGGSPSGNCIYGYPPPPPGPMYYDPMTTSDLTLQPNFVVPPNNVVFFLCMVSSPITISSYSG